MGRRANHEGTISERNGYWEGKISVDGRRQSVTGKTRAEVVAKLDVLRQQASTAGHLPDNRRTVKELAALWYETRSAAWKPKTSFENKRWSDAVGEVLGPATRLVKVRPEHIQRLANQYRDHPRQRQAIYDVARAMLDYAVQLGWLTGNVAERIPRPVYRPPRREIWDREQLTAFLASSRRWQVLWLLLATSGIRLGEALGLRWTDLDPITGRLTIERTRAQFAGETHVGTPKTVSGRRTIALPAITVDALLDWQEQQQREHRALGLASGDGWIFTSTRGTPLSPHSAIKAFKSDATRVGLTGSPHALRHFAASWLLKVGVSLPEVSARLGHGGVAITAKTYAHVLGHDDGHLAALAGGAVVPTRPALPEPA